ncbi:apolipoprotein N-acyltransferase, partial [Streptomyces sp. NPDC127044]
VISSHVDPFTTAVAGIVIVHAASAMGAPVSVGGVVERDGKLYNEQILWDPVKGPLDTYDKRQVQPFGEYLPLRSLLGAINKNWTSMVRQDFSRGDKPGVFTMDGSRVGLVTCYEAAFDWAVRSTVTDGAQLISVPSNNATFDRSEMTYQQLAMSRVRAVEHSRTVTVPVTSGVSAVIMPDGRITQRTGMFVADSLVQKVPLRSSETPATRLGILPEMLGVGVAGGGAAASAGLRHAAETATAAQGLTDRPWYDARRLDTDLLLWRLRDHPDLAAFVERAIGPLRDHDLRSKPPLLPTLETYLAHAGRKAETARELHLNRQTLYNRLARIGELLGTDLDDPQTVLALSLALRARRHVP